MLFRIRPEQFAALAAASERAFVDRTVAFVRTWFEPECEALDDQELSAFVLHGLESGKLHGIESERNVTLYITMMVLHGRDFDQAPDKHQLREILNDLELPPDARLDRLCEIGLAQAEGPTA